MMQLSRIWWNSSKKKIHFLEQTNEKQGLCEIVTNIEDKKILLEVKHMFNVFVAKSGT